jgi:hypothetical protein
MGKKLFFKKVLQVSMLFFLLTTNVFAQVGIELLPQMLVQY